MRIEEGYLRDLMTGPDSLMTKEDLTDTVLQEMVEAVNFERDRLVSHRETQIKKSPARIQSVADEARRLLDAHGLKDWEFTFSLLDEAAGETKFELKMILLHPMFAWWNPEGEVTNVLLHEIGHVLVGPGHAHDEVWRDKFREIGGTGDAAYDDRMPMLRTLAKIPANTPWGYALKPEPVDSAYSA